MNLPRTLHRGLWASVQRGPHDCTLDGLSSRVAEVTIVAVLDLTELHTTGPQLVDLPDNYRVFDASPERPAAYLVKRRMGANTLWHVQPACADLSLAASVFMFGGNSAHLSDSRLADLVGRGHYGALNIHDRDEFRDRHAHVYANHDTPDGGWCPWSGTYAVDRLPAGQCPGGHAAETVDYREAATPKPADLDLVFSWHGDDPTTVQAVRDHAGRVRVTHDGRYGWATLADVRWADDTPPRRRPAFLGDGSPNPSAG